MFIDILISIILGGISGWFAGKLMKSEGNLIRNIVLGILGGVVAGFLLGLVGINFAGYVGTVIKSVLGACLLVYLSRFLFK